MMTAQRRIDNGVFVTAALLLILCLSRGFAVDTPSNGPSRVAVYFIKVLDRGATSFSRKLRGEMMADELHKHRPDWHVHWVTSDEFMRMLRKPPRSNLEGSEAETRSVCIFVKRYSPEVGKACRRYLDGIVLHDTVDNLQYLSRADDAEFLRKNKIDAMIVQTARKAAEAHANGVTALYLPHHHTNFADLHRAPETFTGRAKTLGLLTASANTAPSGETLRAIAEAACRAGMEFVKIMQGQSLPLKTTLTRYICLSDGDISTSVEEFIDDSVVARDDDPYLQLPFHRAPIFNKVDVALLWPPSSHSAHIELRPPTRLLFWMSHGIPVLFYPYVAYTEVTRAHRYYENCVATPELFHDMTDVKDKLAASLQLLATEEHATTRQCLSRQGREITNKYSASALGEQYAVTLERILHDDASE